MNTFLFIRVFQQLLRSFHKCQLNFILFKKNFYWKLFKKPSCGYIDSSIIKTLFGFNLQRGALKWTIGGIDPTPQRQRWTGEIGHTPPSTRSPTTSCPRRRGSNTPPPIPPRSTPLPSTILPPQPPPTLPSAVLVCRRRRVVVTIQ